jgi:2-(1,2-epoxy-1,2-dihydrophenyl)acetyl-CoA isomerase
MKDSMSKVLLDIRDGVATVTLNSPANFNALDEHMLVELAATAADIDRDGKIRVVVLRGAGKAFCAGGDIALRGGRR